MQEQKLKSGTYTNLISKFSRNGKEVIRKEAKLDFGQLRKEILWLLELPAELKPYFPEVLNYQLSPSVFYEMPYYYYPTLRQLLLDGIIDARKALDILEQITEFMFRKVYTCNQANADPDLFQRIHFDRIKSRLIAVRQKSKILRDLIDAKNLWINGDRYENIPMLIRRIQADEQLLKLLKPTYTSMIHGDFHFDNFLIDLPNKKFILIDPRGESSGFDWTYDYGKLWHSFDGLYDFIHEGFFHLNIEKRYNKLSVWFEIERNSALYQYQKINAIFPHILKRYITEYPNNNNWILRISFVQAFHFCSLAPFHLEGNGKERRAIARYITGVKLLNKYLKRYDNCEGEKQHGKY